MRLSFCVVNTDGRELLQACLDAIATTAPAGLEHEVLVLDNASDDGSAAMVRELGRHVRLIELTERDGKAANDTRLLRAARGELCLLLNEDSELCEGAVEALVDALDTDPRAGVAAARLLDASGRPQPCAWRLPGLGTALAGALFLHRWFVVQSRGERTRSVGWAQSSAMLVRHSAAAEVGYLDPAFFVYSDETDLCRRLGDANWRTLWVPAARAVHREQLSADAAAERRIVEFHRGRERYMVKHHSHAVAIAVRALGAWPYLVRALAAVVLPGHAPRRYLLHARQALAPWRGMGLREAAEARNRGRRESAISGAAIQLGRSTKPGSTGGR
ncbi:MAG: glycosyltransferase family 2 protein [Thermoleophilaceae bacterium]|nr:glycosyltransferase family 2 protein [Thermoleophilaceae bacterium]